MYFFQSHIYTIVSERRKLSYLKKVNSQGCESKSLLDSQDFYSGSSTSLTSNQNSFGSSNTVKSSAIKTGEQMKLFDTRILDIENADSLLHLLLASNHRPIRIHSY